MAEPPLVQTTFGLSFTEKIKWWKVCQSRGILKLLFTHSKNSEGCVWKTSYNYDKRRTQPSRNLNYKIPNMFSADCQGPGPRLKITPKTKQQGEIKMPSYTVEKRVFINNEQASDVSDDAIIQQIAAAEAKIKDLEALNTPSKKITKKIRQLKKFCKDTARYLDGRK